MIQLPERAGQIRQFVRKLRQRCAAWWELGKHSSTKDLSGRTSNPRYDDSSLSRRPQFRPASFRFPIRTTNHDCEVSRIQKSQLNTRKTVRFSINTMNYG